MFAKTLTTALVSAALLTGALQTAAFSMEGGGEPSASAAAYHPNGTSVTSRRNRDGSRTVIERDRNGKIVKERIEKKQARKNAKKPRQRQLPSASSTDPNSGITTTVQGNRDGSRTVTKTDRRGRVISTERRGGPGANRPWASAYDPDTRTRTTAIGNGNGTRTVISIGPFGLSIGISR